MSSIALAALLLACSGEPELISPPPAAPPPDPPQVPSRTGTRAKGSSPAEDLAGSWDPVLAAAAPPRSGDDACPDADGDGFASAVACAGRPAQQLDCDDRDPQVTPETERWVPPGPFLMGSASDHAGRDEQPVHVVHLSGYCLDRTEVTTADFAAWLAAADRAPASPDLRGIDRALEVAPGRERHPAEGVTWEEARDYCVARGKTLPTEAQWEKAARGGCELGQDPGACDPDDLRPYPWGKAGPSCTLANHMFSTGMRPDPCVGDSAPVGSLPEGAGPYGHLDLAGNVWEPVADFYNPAVYTRDRERRDPGGAEGGLAHVLRGGGWSTFSTNMRASNRFTDLVQGSETGIRCARPTVPAVADPVPSQPGVKLAGTVSRPEGLGGVALYVSVFDAADADPATGALAPGRSPVAEVKLVPGGGQSQPFSVEVPAGGSYLVMGALDGGVGTSQVAASGSGGFGEADQNPVDARADVDGLTITLVTPSFGVP